MAPTRAKLRTPAEHPQNQDKVSLPQDVKDSKPVTNAWYSDPRHKSREPETSAWHSDSKNKHNVDKRAAATKQKGNDTSSFQTKGAANSNSSEPWGATRPVKDNVRNSDMRSNTKYSSDSASTKRGSSKSRPTDNSRSMDSPRGKAVPSSRKRESFASAEHPSKRAPAKSPMRGVRSSRTNREAEITPENNTNVEAEREIIQRFKALMKGESISPVKTASVSVQENGTMTTITSGTASISQECLDDTKSAPQAIESAPLIEETKTESAPLASSVASDSLSTPAVSSLNRSKTKASTTRDKGSRKATKASESVNTNAKTSAQSEAPDVSIPPLDSLATDNFISSSGTDSLAQGNVKSTELKVLVKRRRVFQRTDENSNTTTPLYETVTTTKLLNDAGELVQTTQEVSQSTDILNPKVKASPASAGNDSLAQGKISAESEDVIEVEVDKSIEIEADATFVATNEDNNVSVTATVSHEDAAEDSSSEEGEDEYNNVPRTSTASVKMMFRRQPAPKVTSDDDDDEADDDSSETVAQETSIDPTLASAPAPANRASEAASATQDTIEATEETPKTATNTQQADTSTEEPDQKDSEDVDITKNILAAPDPGLIAAAMAAGYIETPNAGIKPLNIGPAATTKGKKTRSSKSIGSSPKRGKKSQPGATRRESKGTVADGDNPTRFKRH